MANHHDSMQILNQFVLKHFRSQKGTVLNFFGMPSKSFEIWFVSLKSSIYSDAKFEDKKPIVLNLPTNQMQPKFLKVRLDWTRSNAKRREATKI